MDLPKGVLNNFMDLSFTSFWGQLAGNPILIITVAFTLGVIFVNGWTDAPNAIATCVTTRCLGVRQERLLQLSRRVRHDPDQQLGGLHHQQHGGLRH